METSTTTLTRYDLTTEMKKFSAIFFIVLLSGCATVGDFATRDFDKYGKNAKEIPFDQVQLGETKDTVTRKIGKPARIVASENTLAGLGEVWEYEKWKLSVGDDYLEARYWVYFLDGHLEKWQMVERGEPPQTNWTAVFQAIQLQRQSRLQQKPTRYNVYQTKTGGIGQVGYIEEQK